MRFYSTQLLQWSIIADAIIFLFGPLCYLYFRRLAFFENIDYKLSWKHYVPVFLHLVFSCYIVSFAHVVFIERFSSGYFKTSYFVIEAIGIVSNLYYWFLNTQLLHRYQNEEKKSISFQQNLVSFLKLFQIIVGFFSSVWVISFITFHFFNRSIYLINYDTIWIAVSILVFVVGYYSLKYPALFRVKFTEKTQKNIKKRLPQHQIDVLEKELEYLMNQEKIFLKPDLTLRNLSERLDTSTHNISWYLNNVFDSNFYDYINHYRVKEFLYKIENNEHSQHTILGLSMDVGFNSKSTFNKAFKLEMNETPSNYIKRLKVV
ncbi:AraC family transcriptional regulator [Aquimarina addita]